MSAEITGFRIAPVQEQIWSEQKGNHCFRTECTIRIPTLVTGDELARGAGRLVDRYEILRTRYHVGDGRRFPLQVVLEGRTVALGKDGGTIPSLVESGIESLTHREPALLRIELIAATDQESLLRLSLPSMAGDSRTLLLLADELAMLLRGEEGDEEEVLQYTQYAEWSRQFSDEPDEEGVEFWQSAMTEAAAPILLGWRRNGNEQSTASCSISLDTQQDSLYVLSQHLSISSGDLLTGLWGGFLLRLGKGNNIELGCDLHGREFEELAGVVGPIARTVPLILSGSEALEKSAVDFLKEVAARMEGMREASDYYPFDENEEHRNRTAAVEIVEAPKTGNYTIESIRSVKSSFTLKLSGLLVNERIAAADLLYDTSLLDADSTRLIGEMFIEFTRNILADPERSLDDYRLLSAERLQELQALWNASESSAGSNEANTRPDVPALIEKQWMKAPDAIAVREGEKNFSYAHLMRRADAIGAELQSRGIGQGDIVPICLERSFDAVAAILGIMKIGAAFLPIDPRLPDARQRFMAADSGAGIVVTSGEQGDVFNGTAPILLLSEVRESGTESPSSTTVEVDPDAPAYVIYTSGSTGTPKGCIIRRRNIAAYIGWGLDYYFANSNATGHWPLFTSLSFDLTLTSIFCALAHGGSVTIFGEGVEMPDILREIFSPETIIDTVKMTPAQASLLASTGLKRTNVAAVILGGEQLQPGQVETLRRLNPEIGIFNEYGPTETTVGCIVAKIGPEDERIIIGKPIAGAAAYIADDRGEIVAPCETGELWIAGAGVGAGYLNRPELTAERFRNDLPFTHGETAYRTGDLARRYPDGAIEYLGRNDDQVKVRGYRVELGEIRGALLKLENVADGIVLAIEGTAGENELAAWYVAAGETNEEEIRTGLRNVLPDYMVPQFFVPVDSIPLTVNGKPDTAALPDPRSAGQRTEFIPPRTETERIIAEVWSNVLGQELIGINDNFFQLGGHSLYAMRCIARMNMALETDLKVGIIFEHPTVAELADLADKSRGTAKGRERIEPIEDRDYYELSDAQRRLWVLEQMENLEDTYHIAGAYDVHGEFDVDAFAKGLDALVERHEILRTTFPVVNGVPMQQVHSKGVAVAEFIDLQNAPDTEAALAGEIARAVSAPFDLERGPLFRALILQRTVDNHTILLMIHHIISDGWSVNIMIRELVALYRAYRQQLPADLPPLRIQYRDFAGYQMERLRNGELDESRVYWLGKLAGATPLDLPVDMPRPQIKSYRGRTENFILDRNVVAGLEKIAAENGGSLFMALAALLQTLLYRYTGQEDLTIGTAIAGRDHADLEDQVGFYVNVLPLRTEVKGEETFGALLERVKETATEAYAHQTYPFDRLIDELGMERETGRSPLFDIFLVLQNNERQELRFGDALLTERPLPNTPNKYDLSFDCIEGEEGLECEVNYNSDIFLQERIERMIAHLSTLANGIVSEEGRSTPISSLPLLSKEEQETVIGTGAGNAEFTEKLTKTIPQLIDGIALHYPEKEAILFGEKRISYETMRRRTNGIAALLGTRLAGQEKGREENELNRVAILLPRSEYLPLLFLSILKAGGVCVPVDPDYPGERVRTMLRDCNASIVITDADGQRLLDEGIPVLPIHEIAAAGEPEEAPASTITPDDTAVILYTSGSTGQPKGVMMHHRGLINTGLGQLAILPHSDPINVLQFASFSFDASIFEMLGTFLHGACLTVIPRAVIDDPDAFAELITERGVSYAVLPPAYLATLNKRPLPTLKTLVTAGEPPVMDDALFYAERLNYVNAYGPTECSICVTTHTVSPENDYLMGIPIGSELPNTRVVILDRHGNPLPAGFDGEICVAGIGVTAGYLNGEQTAAAFVEHPLFPGERMYRTGDIGRRLFNGEILFRGRLDNQVKVRGHRVEPEEISATLQEHPELIDAVVVAQKRTGESTRLIAFVVPEGEKVSMPEIRSWLSDRLPPYMIPSFFFAIDELPTSPNGKVNRARLLADAEERIGMETSTSRGREPITDEEKILTETVAAVLGTGHVSPEDNYFMMGGDSITAIQLTWKLREQGYTLKVHEIFAHPLLADAATRLRREERSTPEEKVEGEIPLTPIQQWFFETGSVLHRNRFNQSVLLKKEGGRIDPEKLTQGLRSLTERHDMLRAFYDVSGNQPRQIVAGRVEPSLVVVDLIERARPEEAFREELAKTHASIDITSPSLLKAKVIRTEEGDYLHLVAHHLIVDILSWHILVDDLISAYLSLEEGKEIIEPLKTASYRTWGTRLQELAESNELEKAAAYWEATAAGASGAGTLPVNNASPNVYRDAVSLSVSLDEEKTQGLLGEANTPYNTEPRDIFVAALGSALRRRTNGSIPLIALEGHGRSVEELKEIDVSRTVGWFTALYPVLLPSAQDQRGIIREGKEALRNLPMGGVGYGLCRYTANNAHRIPDLLADSAQIVLNYLGVEGGNEKKDLFHVQPEPEGIGFAPEGRRPFEVEILASVRDGRFRATFTWGAERIEREEIRALAEEWMTELEGLIGHALSVEGAELTPSDVDYDGLSIDDLDDILSGIIDS